jgi:hypothetical protein
VFDAAPPFIPSDAEVMTSIVEWPPGSAGAPPRHSGANNRADIPLRFVDEDELAQRRDRRVARS